MVMKLKSCPRCKGDVMLDRDQYGWYEQCMQCGYLCDVKSIVDVSQPQIRTKKKVTTGPQKLGH